MTPKPNQDTLSGCFRVDQIFATPPISGLALSFPWGDRALNNWARGGGACYLVSYTVIAHTHRRPARRTRGRGAGGGLHLLPRPPPRPALTLRCRRRPARFSACSRLLSSSSTGDIGPRKCQPWEEKNNAPRGKKTEQPERRSKAYGCCTYICTYVRATK